VLTGLEILLTKSQDWERTASKRVSLQALLDPVVDLIIKWRQYELACWPQLFKAVEVQAVSWARLVTCRVDPFSHRQPPA
jgi:midasin (ATPase involved in ribosome maturation)